jgi:hypothetical protein
MDLRPRQWKQIDRIVAAVTEYQGIKNPNGNGKAILNGQEQNAFRHVLLNAALTSQMGEDVAYLVSAQHEGGSLAGAALDKDTRSFTQNPNESDAAFRQRVDTVVDLNNNDIGREIGRLLSPNMTVKDLTPIVAEQFQNNGFFMPSYSRGSDGKLQATISQQTISSEKNNLINERLEQKKQETSSSTTETSKILNANIGKIDTMLNNGNSLQEIKNSGFTAKDIAASLENKVKSQSSNSIVKQQNINSVRVG